MSVIPLRAAPGSDRTRSVAHTRGPTGTSGHLTAGPEAPETPTPVLGRKPSHENHSFSSTLYPGVSNDASAPDISGAQRQGSDAGVRRRERCSAPHAPREPDASEAPCATTRENEPCPRRRPPAGTQHRTRTTNNVIGMVSAGWRVSSHRLRCRRQLPQHRQLSRQLRRWRLRWRRPRRRHPLSHKEARRRPRRGTWLLQPSSSVALPS